MNGTTIEQIGDINHNQTYCVNRLPCGLCMILRTACPMLSGVPYEPSWKPEITCSEGSFDIKNPTF